MTALRALLLLILFATGAAAEPPSIRFEVPPPDSPRIEPFWTRVSGGGAVVAVISIPDARTPSGPLLDPVSIEATYDGVRVPSFLSYRLPHLAVIAAIPGREATTRAPGRPLAITARLAGNDAPLSASLLILPPRVPFIPPSGDVPGLSIQTLDGRSVADGFAFGQRLGGLLGRATYGFVPYDARPRSVLEAHVAVAAGRWATRYEPITSSTVQLAPLSAQARADLARAGAFSLIPLDDAGDASPEEPRLSLRPVSLALEPIPGTPPAPFLIEVGERYWLRGRTGAPLALLVPDRGATESAIIVAPGALPQRIDIRPADRSLAATLRPIPTPAPSRQPQPTPLPLVRRPIIDIVEDETSPTLAPPRDAVIEP